MTLHSDMLKTAGAGKLYLKNNIIENDELLE